MPLIPRLGDAIVHRQSHSPVYILSSWDGPLQMSYDTYEKAAGTVRRFARRTQVDGWYTADEQVFDRIAECRPGQRENSLREAAGIRAGEHVVTIACLNCHETLRLPQRVYEDWTAALDGQPLRCGICTDEGAPMIPTEPLQSSGPNERP